MFESSNTIAHIGTDVAGQMLDALMKNRLDPAVISEVPIAEKKKFLIDNIRALTIPERKEIGDVLITNGRRNAIRECSEGSVINLDALPDHVVSQMYDTMIFKMEKKK